MCSKASTFKLSVLYITRILHWWIFLSDEEIPVWFILDFCPNHLEPGFLAFNDVKIRRGGSEVGKDLEEGFSSWSLILYLGQHLALHQNLPGTTNSCGRMNEGHIKLSHRKPDHCSTWPKLLSQPPSLKISKIFPRPTTCENKWVKTTVEPLSCARCCRHCCFAKYIYCSSGTLTKSPAQCSLCWEHLHLAYLVSAEEIGARHTSCLEEQ